jgi:hypothetical protein
VCVTVLSRNKNYDVSSLQNVCSHILFAYNNFVPLMECNSKMNQDHLPACTVLKSLVKLYWDAMKECKSPKCLSKYYILLLSTSVLNPAAAPTTTTTTTTTTTSHLYRMASCVCQFLGWPVSPFCEKHYFDLFPVTDWIMNNMAWVFNLNCFLPFQLAIGWHAQYMIYICNNSNENVNGDNTMNLWSIFSIHDTALTSLGEWFNYIDLH